MKTIRHFARHSNRLHNQFASNYRNHGSALVAELSFPVLQSLVPNFIRSIAAAFPINANIPTPTIDPIPNVMAVLMEIVFDPA